MPFDFTAVTAGDHMDWITVSPEAIRLTLSLKSFQKARNWPAFLASVSTFMVRSISSFVMLPLSGYLYSPIDPITLPLGSAPLVKTGVILSKFLILAPSIASRLPEGTSFLREKYSVSTISKELGWVITRRVTSSVVTGMYSIAMPVSSFTFLAMSGDWFTAVPR